MREQYDRQLKKLNDELIRMGEMICEAISGAVSALEARENRRAKEIIAYDEEIDQQERLVECEPYMMGGEMRLSRQTREGYTFTEEMEQGELPGHQALREIAALCRERGVEPVFVALPGHASEQEQMDMNSVQRVADELGVPFVNMVRMDIVDNQTDCYDWHGHLNPDGASKATAFLGAWLTERYDLPDRRGDSAYAHWDDNLAQYEAYRAENWTGK